MRGVVIMTDRPSGYTPERARRRSLQAASLWALSGFLGLPLWRVAAARDYTASIEALQRGVVAETKAHRRYVVFGQHAKGEGYSGLAYLYTALATSELIHAQNYIRVLATLGEHIDQPEVPVPPVGTAKDNLIYAAERELGSIERVYPELLQAAEAEGHAEAIATIRYAWASHKQHLDIIEKIRRWSPSFFEALATKIDDKTDRYFVCGVCGSTVTKVPDGVCPICGEPPSAYRLIAPDRFF